MASSVGLDHPNGLLFVNALGIFSSGLGETVCLEWNQHISDLMSQLPPSAWIGLIDLFAYPMHNPVSDTGWRRQNAESGKRATVRRGQG